MIPESYGIELVNVSALTAFSGNPRTHSERQIEQIAASIREFGWTNPILVDAAGVIIAGHGRLAAASRLGLEQVPVSYEYQAAAGGPPAGEAERSCEVRLPASPWYPLRRAKGKAAGQSPDAGVLGGARDSSPIIGFSGPVLGSDHRHG